MRILQLVVHLIDTLPVAQPCASDWIFIPAAATVPNQVVVAPSIPAEVCQRGEIRYEPLAGPANNRNFQAVLFGDSIGN